MNIFSIFLFLCSLLHMVTITTLSVKKDVLTVKTSTGLVRGKLNVYKNFSYYSFEGIPYGESVSGEYRFMPPTPKEPWPYILDATQESPVCPQLDSVYKMHQMTEDCLYLNIYVPARVSNKLLPTFVNIHGGGLTLLSGNVDFLYGPELILQKNIIFVSMNYRLNALGFLSVDEESACGNAGIKDIVLSLKWIQKNLKYFGGDSKRVTVGGHSSGGTLAHYLMLSKKTSRLFQRIIIISGSAVHHRFVVRHPKDIAFSLAEKLGNRSNDSRKILKHLKYIDQIELSKGFLRMKQTDPYAIIRPYSPFAPTVDKACTNAFIDMDPETILKVGLPQNVPVLTGVNANEGLYMIPYILRDPGYVERIKNNLEILIPSKIEYPEGSKEAKELSKSITHFYFGKENITNDEFCLLCITNYISDIQNIVYSTDWWIRTHKARNDSNKVYYYQFHFDGMLNWAKINYNISVPGVAHADELGYLFRTKRTKPLEDNLDSRTERMRETMVNLFTNFIKYGNPTPQHKKNDIIWPDYGKEQNYLQINDELKVMKRAHSAKTASMNFWDNVYERYFDYVKFGGRLEKKVIP